MYKLRTLFAWILILPIILDGKEIDNFKLIEESDNHYIINFLIDDLDIVLLVNTILDR